MASGDPTRGWPTGQHTDHTPASRVERAGRIADGLRHHRAGPPPCPPATPEPIATRAGPGHHAARNDGWFPRAVVGTSHGYTYRRREGDHEGTDLAREA
jgi:hypothetical protein